MKSIAERIDRLDRAWARGAITEDQLLTRTGRIAAELSRMYPSYVERHRQKVRDRQMLARQGAE